jgi:hypothetical protein
VAWLLACEHSVYHFVRTAENNYLLVRQAVIFTSFPGLSHPKTSQVSDKLQQQQQNLVTGHNSLSTSHIVEMGIGAVLEPAVVVGLLFGGTYFNRNTSYRFTWKARARSRPVLIDEEDAPGSPASWASDDALLERKRTSSDSSSSSLLDVDSVPSWRSRNLKLFGFTWEVTTPNSKVFEDRWFSRVIRKFPFLEEAFYWALIYWVCCPIASPFL